MRNEKLNQKLAEGLRKEFHHEVVRDDNGRAAIDKSKPIGCSNNKKRPGVVENDVIFSKKPQIQIDSPDCQANPDSPIEEIDVDPPSPVVSVGSTPPQNLDDYWLRDLDLKISDKHLILDGYWLNDRIINAAMALLRDIDDDISGLQDVIVAKKNGFIPKDNTCKFIQIIHIRGHHWITLSNLQCSIFDAIVYDSLHGINVKPNQQKISYPIIVEQTACRLSKTKKPLRLSVEDVQQQTGGGDCGLFAIAFATLLCLGEDPSQTRYCQDKMRKELIRSLEDRNMENFLQQCTSPKEGDVHILYEWDCPVYCHCKMPDDGELMVRCPSCNDWFHKDCEKGDYTNPDWLCLTCHNRKAQQARAKQEASKQQTRDEDFCYLKSR